MVCSPGDLRDCFVDEIECRGSVRFSGSISEKRARGTSACAYSGLLPARCGRGWRLVTCRTLAANAGGETAPNYRRTWRRRGELRIYPGRTVPVRAFVADVRADLAGAKVRGRRMPTRTASAELRDCLPWAAVNREELARGRTAPRRCGRFSRAVLTGKTLTLRSNLSSRDRPSKSRRCGRDAQRKSRALIGRRSAGRIDVLSAAVLAVGAGSKPRPARGGIVRSAICEATA